MGNSAVKERFTQAKSTHMLNLSDIGFDDWDDLTNPLAAPKTTDYATLRSITIINGKLRGAVPSVLVDRAPCFGQSLKTLTLSGHRISDVAALSRGGVLTPAGKASPSNGVEMLDALRSAIAGGGRTTTTTTSSSSSWGGDYPLESLVLSNNEITTIPVLFCAMFPKLKTLDLSGNRIELRSKRGWTDGAATACVSFGTTWDLIVMDTLVFAAMPSLTTLNMERNAIAQWPVGWGLVGAPDRAPPAWPGDLPPLLPSLQTVNLARNAVSAFAVPPQFAFPAVRTIDLSAQLLPAQRAAATSQGAAVASVVGQALRAVDHASFDAFPSLRSLELADNESKAAILDALRQQEGYIRWSERRARTVSRQIASGARATMTE